MSVCMYKCVSLCGGGDNACVNFLWVSVDKLDMRGHKCKASFLWLP